MKRALSMAVLATVGFALSNVDAAREPRKSFKPVRFLTEARADDRFHVGPPPPTRDEQLRPLPSFATPPGFHGIHGSIWNRIRHYDWTQQQAAREEVEVIRIPWSAPRTILFVRRNAPSTQTSSPTSSTTLPTTQPALERPIIESIRIR